MNVSTTEAGSRDSRPLHERIAADLRDGITGGSAHSTLLEVAEAVPPADVRGLLETAAGDTAVLRRRLLFIGDASPYGAGQRAVRVLG